MKVYLDNNLITYLFEVFNGDSRYNTPDIQKETKALIELFNMPQIETVVSDESLYEIRQICETESGKQVKEKLDLFYHLLKAKKSVIRNAEVPMDDTKVYVDSMDVLANHNYTNVDLNRVNDFFQARENNNEEDARYIANAMLHENHIDVFLTNDRKTILNYQSEILKEFGVKVIKPSQLLAELKSN